MAVERPLPIQLAFGSKWLKLYMAGKTIKQIAQAEQRSTRTVTKYMSRAASAMVEQAQVGVMAELVPIAKAVLKASMETQLRRGAKDQDINIELAERILKMMSVLGLPQKPDQDDLEIAQTEITSESVTLGKYLSERPLPRRIGDRERPALSGQVIDANESQAEPESASRRESREVEIDEGAERFPGDRDV